MQQLLLQLQSSSYCRRSVLTASKERSCFKSHQLRFAPCHNSIMCSVPSMHIAPECCCSPTAWRAKKVTHWPVAVQVHGDVSGTDTASWCVDATSYIPLQRTKPFMARPFPIKPGAMPCNAAETHFTAPCCPDDEAKTNTCLLCCLLPGPVQAMLAGTRRCAGR